MHASTGKHGLSLCMVLPSRTLPSYVQVADGMTPSHPDKFAYCSLEVADLPSVDLVSHFSRCFKFIDEALSSNGEHCRVCGAASAPCCV